MNNEITKFNPLIKDLVETANEFVVSNQEEATNAGDYLSNIKKLEKQIESKRTEITKPINQSLKTINENFKEAVTPLKEASNTFKTKILAWRIEENERIIKEKEALIKLTKAAEKTEDKEMIKIVEQIKEPEEIKTTMGNTQTRKIWRYEIIEFSKVPEGYKEINPVRVNTAIRDGVRDIPGLKIYQEEIIAINSK